MKKYTATPETGYSGKVGTVFVHDDAGNEEPLNPRFDLYNHSPTGFAWGYNGSGPAQLALALLADALGEHDNADELALRFYQTFKVQVICLKPDGEWSMTQESIENWLGRAQAEGFLAERPPEGDDGPATEPADKGLQEQASDEPR